MVFLCDKPFTGEIEGFPKDIPPYPYPLSDFQKYAIEAVIKGHHVLVTAHTGSGKTLPAEFALQHLTNQGKKVIYTSPIKALSNQKFYDFTNKYPHISFGLLTGDIKTNPTAQVLIMTTEILMNALFNKGTSNETRASDLSFQMDIDNELGCVIFDEVHYINDADRGQTWEQTILMLPRHIQMVMLSATIDNPIGFAEWVENRGIDQTGAEKKVTKKVYLASTEHRVVPLTHYGYFATTETPFKVIKDKTIQQEIRDATNKFILLRTPSGEFKDAGYHEIKSMNNLFDKYDWRMKRKFVLNNLATHLNRSEMLPAIVFVFSRKAVEQCAKEITSNLLEDDSKVPYIVRNECEQIVRRFPNFREYLELPEYNELVSLLEKGIGIHHSGMIPVLREIVELMITKKYIKMLFATESFAIGLDCPIKTAVFSALRKFDGTQNRFLLPHEYTQMAGRAGRRGIDTVGHVIHCNNLFDLPSLAEYKQILCGRPQKLVSKFKLSYPLVLSLLKTGKVFGQFVSQSMLQRELDKTIRGLDDEYKSNIILYDKKREALQFNRTPEDICLEAIQIEDNLSMYSAKKQKECRRKLQDFQDQYKTFKQDMEKHREIEVIKKDIKKGEQDISYMNEYTNQHISYLCDILLEAGFLQSSIDDTERTYDFTSLGQIAAQVHEVHPLLAGDMIRETDFVSYTPIQIAGFLSIFTDIKLPDDMRAQRPKGDPIVIKDICILEQRADYYARRELDLGVVSKPVEFCFDLVPLITQWCIAGDDAECKAFIQEPLAEADISVGDFTKSVLKIVVIAKEFQTVAEIIENLGFLSALKTVEILMLKYVATNQSLYV